MWRLDKREDLGEKVSVSKQIRCYHRMESIPFIDSIPECRLRTRNYREVDFNSIQRNEVQVWNILLHQLHSLLQVFTTNKIVEQILTQQKIDQFSDQQVQGQGPLILTKNSIKSLHMLFPFSLLFNLLFCYGESRICTSVSNICCCLSVLSVIV